MNVDERGCHFRDGGGEVHMRARIAIRWTAGTVAGACPFSRLFGRWTAFALAVMLMIGMSESGRTFASLVADSRVYDEVHLGMPFPALTGRRERGNPSLVSREQELLQSIELGENDHVKAMLLAGVSANTTDPHGWTPCMLAALHNRTLLIPVLSAHGADLNAKNAKGTTALMLAANNGHLEMVRLLLVRGVQVNAKTTAGWTALMYAAWKGHTVIMRELLRAAADPTVSDSQGWTPLMYAAWQGHIETVQLLLASQNMKNINVRERNQARMLAASQGHAAIVSLLDKMGRRG